MSIHKIWGNAPYVRADSPYTPLPSKCPAGKRNKVSTVTDASKGKVDSWNQMGKLFCFATFSRHGFCFPHFQIVILLMNFFIKLSIDRPVIGFKPGMSSVIGI